MNEPVVMVMHTQGAPTQEVWFMAQCRNSNLRFETKPVTAPATAVDYLKHTQALRDQCATGTRGNVGPALHYLKLLHLFVEEAPHAPTEPFDTNVVYSGVCFSGASVSGETVVSSRPGVGIEDIAVEAIDSAQRACGGLPVLPGKGSGVGR